MHHDGTAGLLHDAVHGCEPESGAVTDGLRREERIEDAPLRLGIHSHSGVPDDDGREPIRRRRGARRGRSRGGGEDGRLERERTAVRHRIARIDDEIQNDLLQLSAVGEHHAGRGVAAIHEGDLGSNQPAQHRFGAAHDVVDLDRHRLQHLTPAEGEELAGERGPPVRGTPDLADVAREVGVVVRLREDQLAVADDDGEQIVEVVRHPAGEPPDGLHALRLPQFLFQAYARGDVARHGERGAAPLIGERNRDRFDFDEAGAIHPGQGVVGQGHGASVVEGADALLDDRS